MARLKRHEISENTSINMTPLLDVIFQLIVFLVLTSSMVRPTQIEIRLPESTTAVKATDQMSLVISYRVVDGKPVLNLNSEPVVDLDRLAVLLRQRRGEGEQPRVDIQIDKSAAYEDVVRLMDTARDTGYPKFSLLTLAPAARRTP